MNDKKELQVKKEETALAMPQVNITDEVLVKIQKFERNGQIFFPNNYSPENALKNAWLKLQEVKDKNNNLALDVCSKPSVANALLNMVIQGLNPAKNQCYFIPYGNQLTLMRSYFGSIAVAKQFGEIEDITAEVIYQEDEVETEIENGKTIVTKHKRKFGNIDKKQIIGAYATIIYKENAHKKNESLVMTMEQIKTSWKKSKTNPNSAESVHSLYTEDMCKRTVTNKICKYYINSKDDSNLNILKEAFESSDEDMREAEVTYEIQENANKTVIDVETGEIQEESTNIQVENTLQPIENETKEVNSPSF